MHQQLLIPKKNGRTASLIWKNAQLVNSRPCKVIISKAYVPLLINNQISEFRLSRAFLGSWWEIKWSLSAWFSFAPTEVLFWISFSDYRTQFLKAVNTGLGSSSTRGLWIDSCYAHCQSGSVSTWLNDKSPEVGDTVMTSISSFYLPFSTIYNLILIASAFLLILVFTAENGKGCWRLVLRPKCRGKNRLPLPLQPYLCQCWFWIVRAVS